MVDYLHGMVHPIAANNQTLTLPTYGQIMDITEIRYTNFKQLFEKFKEETRRDDPGAPEKGMLKLFGDRLGIRQAYMSHLNTKYKGIGPTTARQIEQALGLSHGWMDQQHNKKRTPEPAPVSHAESAPVDEAPATSDAEELEFLETAIKLYRTDPIAAQGALLRVMASKYKS
jgi:hypothetical protein